MTCLESGDADDPVERQAREIWVTECAGCHGLTGDGRGPEARDLQPPPPDFSDPCRKLTDTWIERVIVSGGASYRGNPAMRPHHELEHRREILDKLVTYVQSLRREGACTEKNADPPLEPTDV